MEGDKCAYVDGKVGRVQRALLKRFNALCDFEILTFREGGRGWLLVDTHHSQQLPAPTNSTRGAGVIRCVHRSAHPVYPQSHRRLMKRKEKTVRQRRNHPASAAC